MLRLITLLLCLWFGGTQAAVAGLPGLDNPDNWRLREVIWADRGGVPQSSQFNAGLTAHYNMAYGTTVLGLTARVPDDNLYYAVIASCEDSQLTTLDYLGPLDSAPQWHSGPYHVATGLPDGQIVVWLTAPGEFPVPVVAARNYIPGTQLTCEAYPPDPPSKRWTDWTATVAYEGDPDYPGLEVITIDGLGRTINALDWLDLDSHLTQVCLREYAVGDRLIPGMLLKDSRSVYSAWHHPTWGWRAEKLAGSNLGRVRIWLNPNTLQPKGLAIFNDHADIHDSAVLQEIRISINANTGISARWGTSVNLDERCNYSDAVFIDSTQYIWPLIVQSTETDIWLSFHNPDPRDKPGSLVFTGSRLYIGEKGLIGSEEVALHPIVSISGAAHWRTGNPELFWVQLGGGRLSGEGALFHLEYVATGQY